MFSISSSSSNGSIHGPSVNWNTKYNFPKKMKQSTKLMKSSNVYESESDKEDGVIFKSTSMLSKIDLMNKHLEKKIIQNKKKKVESPIELSSDLDEIPSFFKINSTQ